MHCYHKGDIVVFSSPSANGGIVIYVILGHRYSDLVVTPIRWVVLSMDWAKAWATGSIAYLDGRYHHNLMLVGHLNSEAMQDWKW